MEVVQLRRALAHARAACRLVGDVRQFRLSESGSDRTMEAIDHADNRLASTRLANALRLSGERES
jgi:hypothetical protein